MAQSISKKTFYGPGKSSKSIDVKAKIERRVQQFKQNPVPQKYKQRLTSSSVWEIFYKQADAFACMKRKRHKDLHVFSFESKVFFEHHGQRLYLVTTNEHFWHYYSQLNEVKRNYYEVIPEGAVCHLYFDLEFSKDLNPASNGNRMVQTFIKVIQFHLQKQFNEICTKKHIIELDSSNEVKFSQHLTFRLPNAAFKDNVNAGNFVKKICRNLSCAKNREDGVADCLTGYDDSGVSRQDICELFVLNKENARILFCDTGVYTKNRNFRLYLSSKFNKNTPLKLSKNCQYAISSSNSTNLDHKTIFFDSLVANVQYEPGIRILSDEESVEPRRSVDRMIIDNKSENKGAHMEGRWHSPYLKIDTFIESVISKKGTVGKIRRWTYFHQGELLVYDISYNRWCHNIQREHKSNNIMLLVDIKRGVYYQKCYDPDCKAIDFKSDEWKLPDDILPAYFMQEEMSDFDTDTRDGKKINSEHGRLSEVDFDKYFDSDDQDLLKAMNMYEVDTHLNPEWFDDMDEEDFCQTRQGQRNHNCSIVLGNKSKHSTNVKNAPSKRNCSEREEVKSWRDDNYLDPSWFEEEFS